MSTPAPVLPPAAADVAAEAVEALSPRLRKKLDAAIEQYAALAITAEGAGITVTCGEDAVVTLTPDESGALTRAEQAHCSCLLAPRCLHRAALLSACPVADTASAPDAATDSPAVPVDKSPDTSPAVQPAPVELTAAQIAAAEALWSAAAAVLAAGIPSAGAVPQAELLRAAHTARLAGLHRAEAAALRVVSGLRDARARRSEHRLADLASALRDVLLTAALLAAADPDPALIGVARRPYEPGGALRVRGVCREPIISATGYAGVVTHVIGDDGRWYSAADVKPGGPGRALAAATAPVTIGAGASGAATLDHARLARGGLLINGATVSADGRLGSGKGVRATPISGLPWFDGPVAAMLGRSIVNVAAERLAVARALGDEQDRADAARELVACDVEILAGQSDHLLVRDLVSGTLIRLVAADAHADLAHTTNLRRLASRPGMRVRLVGRLDPDRSATFRPLGVGPAPGGEATLRLPEDWLGHADLGYDRLQGSHLPPPAQCPPPEPAGAPIDPTADSPLWRYRHVVELAVAGGRRAVGEYARRADRTGSALAPLRTAGFHAGADLARALAAEADRRDRDVFGRLADPDPDAYARAWLAAAAHLAATERALILASWSPGN